MIFLLECFVNIDIAPAAVIMISKDAYTIKVTLFILFSSFVVPFTLDSINIYSLSVMSTSTSSAVITFVEGE